MRSFTSRVWLGPFALVAFLITLGCASSSGSDSGGCERQLVDARGVGAGERPLLEGFPQHSVRPPPKAGGPRVTDELSVPSALALALASMTPSSWGAGSDGRLGLWPRAAPWSRSSWR